MSGRHSTGCRGCVRISQAQAGLRGLSGEHGVVREIQRDTGVPHAAEAPWCFCTKGTKAQTTWFSPAAGLYTLYTPALLVPNCESLSGGSRYMIPWQEVLRLVQPTHSRRDSGVYSMSGTFTSINFPPHVFLSVIFW